MCASLCGARSTGHWKTAIWTEPDIGQPWPLAHDLCLAPLAGLACPALGRPAAQPASCEAIDHTGHHGRGNRAPHADKALPLRIGRDLVRTGEWRGGPARTGSGNDLAGARRRVWSKALRRPIPGPRKQGSESEKRARRRAISFLPECGQADTLEWTRQAASASSAACRRSLSSRDRATEVRTPFETNSISPLTTRSLGSMPAQDNTSRPSRDRAQRAI